MRKSEILNLQWKNINIEHGVIYLLDTKNGERREALINDTVKRAPISVPKNPNSPYVFCHENGKPYLNVRKSFDAVLKKCGIIDFRFHDLRHTFASQLVMAGVNIKTVQELLRHKDIKTTMRYAHLSPDHKMRAVETLNRQLVPDLSPEVKAGDSSDQDSLPNLLGNKELVT